VFRLAHPTRGTNCQAYTEEKLREDGTTLEHCPQKSLRHQAQKTVIFNLSFITFLKKQTKKNPKHMNLNLLWRCQECVHDGAVPASAVI
jgi:hypothetical protein